MSGTSTTTLAFDLGASSGRAVVGQCDGTTLTITDVHRFPNDPVRVHQRMYWDILRLLHEIKQGLIAARLQYDDIQSLGIDTWGVDFGLLGSHGELLGSPYHYRDGHTTDMMDRVKEIVPRAELFARTGIQFIPINTLYQLYALTMAHSPLLEQARTLLMIPELLRYFLTGERYSEWTVASTSQLCNPYTHTWDRELLTRLGLPTHLFLDPVMPGSHVGTLHPVLCEELNVPAYPVIAVAEHDTASAVVAVPAEEDDFTYLSSGTWSLLGTELPAPLINEQVLAWNITNEGGINNTVRFLKNVTGLWLIQECRRVWRTEGRQFSYMEEQEAIEQTTPFQSYIDPDDAMFLNPLHMPHQIQHYCQQTNQYVPQTEGELLRCIVESLALRYRFVLEGIEALVQKHFRGLHIVGGGTQHTLLCQYTANALARPVWAGPQEATATGNLLVQYLALGTLHDLRHARQVVRNSFPIRTYAPQHVEAWNSAYETFCRVTHQKE